MARNEVKTLDYSFQGRTEGIDYRLKAFVIFCACFTATLQVAAQFIAYQYMYHPARGSCLKVGGYKIYPFYRAAYWLFELMRAYEKGRSSVAAMSAFVFASGLLLSVFITRLYIFRSRNGALESIHGTAHWATLKEIKEAGLLDKHGEPFPEGVVVGGVKIGRKVKMMKHNGKEHVCPYRAVLHCL
jgi:type IV secretion system protein VirD4